jgi:hypothetical protein
MVTVGTLAVHCPSAAAPWLRLLLAIAATTSASVAQAAVPVWRTSGDVVTRAQAPIARLDAPGVEAVIARLPRSLTLIRDYLRDKGVPVYLHKGDLTIDGSFANTHALVVDGTLTIRGSYDDYRNGGIGMLVVLGDLRAEHVVSWGSMAVTGTLDATGLVYAYYNDYSFEVAGPVTARAVVVFDKSTNNPRVDAAIRQTDDGQGAALAVRHFVPELMIEDILDKTDADTPELLAVVSYDTARTRIAAGLPIFRELPGPESLAGDVLRLFRPRLDAATRARLARTDPLLAMVARQTGR